MSSRALRRLQREQEEKRQLASLQAQEEEDASEEEQVPTRPAKTLNAFDLLEGGNDDEEDDEELEVEEKGPVSEAAVEDNNSEAPKSKKPKKKKKKPKKKGKEKSEKSIPGGEIEGGSADPEMDEIDRALKELSAKAPSATGTPGTRTQADYSSISWHLKTSKLLSVDGRNLNPLTEMKSLFGNVALESVNSAASRPRGRGDAEHLDLGTALMGRYSPASKGQEFGALAGRRNIFMQAKAEWPRTTSGGLGMEFVKDTENGEKIYQIVHNSAYTTTQHNFHMAVEMMQPERMIQLLQFNPYHIATLLQVSEIAKHQGDHSVAADLLERALFTFGRSVHSTLSMSLREGLARLEFDVAENRELWLTIWRYISNLGMRGTWRTAFEWAKVLLSLSPLKDPYSITLFIDQLALRGRQQEQLIRLCEDDAFGQTWSHLPNIQISLALAYHRTKDHTRSRQTLAEAIHKYPYILARLFQELDLSPLPKSIWGSLPSTDAEKLYTELYATRAKDLWNTPETTSLLMEVTQSIDSYDLSHVEPAPKLEISLEEARHVLLTETPALIALLPRRFTSMPTSGVDPLPPPSSLSTAGLTSRAPGETVFPSPTEAIRSAANAGAGWFTRLMDWFQGPGRALEGDELGEAFQEALAAEADAIPQQILEAFQNQQPVPMEQEGFSDTDSAGVPSFDDQPVESAESRNPLAATVEDDESEEDERNIRANMPTHDNSLLRSERSPSPDISSRTPQPEPAAAAKPTLTKALLDDPQRTQRWLISTGTEPLQSLVDAHGPDPSKWPATRNVQDQFNKYYTAMMHIRPVQRDWVINVLSQRDKHVAEAVKTAMKNGQAIDIP